MDYFKPDNTQLDIVLRFYEDRKSVGLEVPLFSFTGHMRINGTDVSITSNVIRPISQWANIFGQEIPQTCIERLIP